MTPARRCALATVFAALSIVGCASPFYTDKGALVGGLAGAGTGAVIGDALGHTGAGALIGAGVGTLTGAAVGSGLDDIEARNRAQIAAQIGRQLPPGNVSLPDVVAMTKAGVDEEVIVNHVHTNGLVQPITTGDLIMLQNEGVSKRVIAALQAPRQVAGPPGAIPGGVVPGVPPPVVVPYPYYYPPPYWGPPPPYYAFSFGRGGCRPRPRVGWGVSFGGPFW